MTTNIPNEKVPEAKEKFWPQYCIVITAGICFFYRGLHTAWPSPSLPLLLNKTAHTAKDIFGDDIVPHRFTVTTDEASWVVVIYSIAICVGSPLSAFLMNAYGRKTTILVSTVPAFAAFAIIALAPSVEYLYIARLLAGLSEGLSNIVIPAYVGEIAHPLVRGRLGCIMSVILTLGVLSMNIIGSFIPITTTAIICCIFPVILMLVIHWLPESPYYLLMKGKSYQAEKSLSCIRGSDKIQNELNQISNTVEKQMIKAGSFHDLFFIKSHRKALIVAMMLEVVQQASGISAIQSYTQVIFIESKQSLSHQTSAILLMLIQTCVGILGTNLVDRLGRKPLLVVSCVGCGFALTLEGFYFYMQYIESSYLDQIRWLPLTALVFFIAVYSSGLAIVLNVFLGELFSANVKAKALAVNGIWYGLLSFVVSRFFQVLIDLAGLHLPFWIYAVNCFLGAFYISYCVPETKGKTLDEIQEWFKR